MHLSNSFCGSGFWAQLRWVPIQYTIKVSVRVGFSLEGLMEKDLPQRSLGCIIYFPEAVQCMVAYFLKDKGSQVLEQVY